MYSVLFKAAYSGDLHMEIFEQQNSWPAGTPVLHSPRLYTSMNMGRRDDSRSILEDEVDL
ncbi:hypothetical protein FRC12_006514 [Ceratobasidium sp. 428]|nr:hypothetical protein FRC12_006514 [Ceratobasidium sp. 428]